MPFWVTCRRNGSETFVEDIILKKIFANFFSKGSLATTLKLI